MISEKIEKAKNVFYFHDDRSIYHPRIDALVYSMDDFDRYCSSCLCSSSQDDNYIIAKTQ